MLNKVFNFVFRDCLIHIVNLLTSLLPNSYLTSRIRGFLIRPLLGKCGRKFRIASGVIINNPSRLSIGDNVYIAHNVWINATGGLEIGDDSIIGPMSVIVTSKHIFENNKAVNKGIFNPVVIGKGCWIASHCVITDGVVIGDGVLVAAGAVVTHNISNNVMIGGIPAKIISKERKNNENEENYN